MLLLVPLPFYALSVAYGGVPIFIPAVVAILSLQRALRIAVASGLRRGLRSSCIEPSDRNSGTFGYALASRVRVYSRW